ncbi:MAG: GNAT family N-acetyltransferase [Burkholderiales bacterium]|nr:GNAT family N-acetyltransferase [Burkholderiales bacterium]
MARERLRIAESLAEVAPAAWDALAEGDPFVSHAFLSALVETGCASAASGWRPRFLLLERDGALAAAMPLFEKSHSWGEYVFDWAWAEAYRRAGVAYYPKLVCAVPFTPVAGPRLLAREPADRARLIEAALELARAASSLHVLFPHAPDAAFLEARGLMLRRAVQFHWTNAGYADFDDFLARLTAHRRKVIRQERRRVREAGVRLRRLRGQEIERAHWAFFARCYRRTYAERGMRPYLNLEFFLRIGATMPAQLVLVLAERGAQPIGCALFVESANALYGRYWGALEPVPLLHFECCYYQGIEYAIERRLARFEGGAQGVHKLARGLLPVETVSAHWLAHPRLARAIEAAVARERAEVERCVDELAERSPFRAPPEGTPRL